MNFSLGKKIWAFADGRIPPDSNGPEPANTSHDRISILNTGEEDAHLEITFYYEDQEPKGIYHLVIKAKRLRQIRVNDLIDPEAIPLDVPYGAVVISDVPVIVQFSRQDTSSVSRAICSFTPFGLESD